jgi:hypothetical protein
MMVTNQAKEGLEYEGKVLKVVKKDSNGSIGLNSTNYLFTNYSKYIHITFAFCCYLIIETTKNRK